MSYQAQAMLSGDPMFMARNRSAAMQQAEIFKDDQRPDFVAVAVAVLRDEGDITGAFPRLAAAGPGIADKADQGDGTINQDAVTDGDLLALTQANWPTIANLYFNDDGTRKE